MTADDEALLDTILEPMDKTTAGVGLETDSIEIYVIRLKETIRFISIIHCGEFVTDRLLCTDLPEGIPLEAGEGGEQMHSNSLN